MYDRVLSEDEVKQLASADPVTSLLLVANRTEQQNDRLREHFLNKVHQPYAKTKGELRAAENVDRDVSQAS